MFRLSSSVVIFFGGAVVGSMILVVRSVIGREMSGGKMGNRERE